MAVTTPPHSEALQDFGYELLFEERLLDPRMERVPLFDSEGWYRAETSGAAPLFCCCNRFPRQIERRLIRPVLRFVGTLEVAVTAETVYRFPAMTSCCISKPDECYLGVYWREVEFAARTVVRRIGTHGREVFAAVVKALQQRIPRPRDFRAVDEFVAGVKQFQASRIQNEQTAAKERLDAVNAFLQRARTHTQCLPDLPPWVRILGLDVNTLRELHALSDSEIWKAYRARARERHPDRGGGHKEMKTLNEALRAALERETKS